MPAAPSKKINPDVELAKALAKYWDDPLGYVMFCFPWHTERSIQLCELVEPWKTRFPNAKFGPDAWACKFLDELGAQIKKRGFDPLSPKSVTPIRFSTASGHGIGKSALVAWLVKFILDTRPLSVGTVTANTANQLKGKTWAEVGKWHRLSLTKEWFTYNSGRGAMALISINNPENWKCTAETCREENSEAFAGQHAPAATSFYIFDEASGIPGKIFEVREGGTTDGEPMTFDFGNPTQNSGMFFENCAGRFKHRYIVKNIDSRSVAITNKERIEQWREDYGEDSDFFKVRVKGEFPSAGTLQFIPTAYVDDAMRREAVGSGPLVIGVDVARHGDDESVIYPRIGDDARSFAPWRYRGLDTVQLTGKVIEALRYFRGLGKVCSGLFVDGVGIGGAVVDQLLHLGYSPIEVQAAGSAIDSMTYRFKGDECWGLLKDWLQRRGCIPWFTQDSGQELREQLTQRWFGYTTLGNKIHLESKKDMKERLGASGGSPDIADALALTFAMPVAEVDSRLGHNGGPTLHAVDDYDPLEDRLA